ncbi:MAG: hypothetical protein J7M08_08955 [Planctomycetes bacterium]|nr:hypothetical protein [Planctomycetota bacterium]
MIDWSKLKTYPIAERKNLVSLEDFVHPDQSRVAWDNEEFGRLCRHISNAARDGRPVLLQFGAHVIKCGLGLVVRDLMERGFVSHVAMNGACVIHDFEIALIGETSEDVASGIEDGSFGMAEETGRFINETVNATGEGFGKAVGRRISTEQLPHRSHSVLAGAFEMGIPATVHVAIGTDIVHQHPTFDGAKTGAASHRDFETYIETVCGMSGGVLLNFGSAVILPEVFLKALSMSRNLGHPVAPLYTASFDLRRDVEDYYFRPAKNVVRRPVSLGGEGFNFRVDHRQSLPSMHRKLIQIAQEE